MVDSISGLTNVAVALQQQKISEQISTAVLNKAQEVQKQQGQEALQLIEPATGTQHIDVHA
ncbi:MAG: putative motility protein [Methylobacter sp.]|nr:putative motility protein [Methylobacter sp.]